MNRCNLFFFQESERIPLRNARTRDMKNGDHGVKLDLFDYVTDFINSSFQAHVFNFSSSNSGRLIVLSWTLRVPSVHKFGSTI